MTRDMIIFLAKEVTAQTEAVHKNPNIVQLKEFYLGSLETGPIIEGVKCNTVTELFNHPVMLEFMESLKKGG